MTIFIMLHLNIKYFPEKNPVDCVCGRRMLPFIPSQGTLPSGGFRWNLCGRGPVVFVGLCQYSNTSNRLRNLGPDQHLGGLCPSSPKLEPPASPLQLCHRTAPSCGFVNDCVVEIRKRRISSDGNINYGDGWIR